jgi:hypothetical protein
MIENQHTLYNRCRENTIAFVRLLRTEESPFYALGVIVLFEGAMFLRRHASNYISF